MSFGATTIAQGAKPNPQANDITFPNPPSDSVSCLSVNGNRTTPTNMLIAGSWDNSLSMYELQYAPTGAVTNIIRHQQLMHDAPVLCSDIGPDGMTTFSAGADGNIRMWNATQPVATAQIIGRHEQPVKCMKFLEKSQVLVTASWDKSIKIWDLRTPNPVAQMQLSERVYAMDAKEDIIVAGTADKVIHIFQLQNKMGEYNSPLNYQTRTISMFGDNQGFAIGSIEGRVSLEYFSEMQLKIQNSRKPPATKPAYQKSFAFRCHRDTKDIYAVNSIDFHHYGTFCTAGSDGTIVCWDKDSRSRLSGLEAYSKKCPISSVKFSPMGNSLFYAMSYDWSKGAEFHNPAQMGNNIMMHAMIDSEIQPKPKKT